MSPTVDARRRWPQRLLRTAPWLALGWLALSNLALNLGPAEAALSRQPERFRMQWSRALSLWPGRILLWDVTMQGQTRRNAWEIRAGRVSGRIALWPLLRKELRVAWLEGETPRIAIEPRQFTPIAGEMPSPSNPPPGCHFHPRCPHAMPVCRSDAPPLRRVAPGHRSACHLNPVQTAEEETPR